MTEVTDEMFEAACGAFQAGYGLRSAIEAALAAREPVDAGELVQRLLNNPDVDCDIAADAIEDLVKALKPFAKVKMESGDEKWGVPYAGDFIHARDILTRMGVKLP